MLGLESFYQFLVIVVEVFGDDDFEDGVLVALFAAAFYSAAFDAELGSAAGTGGDCDCDGAVEGGDLDFTAQEGFVNADGDIDVDVEIFAAEVGVGLDAGDDE